MGGGIPIWKKKNAHSLVVGRKQQPYEEKGKYESSKLLTLEVWESNVVQKMMIWRNKIQTTLLCNIPQKSY